MHVFDLGALANLLAPLTEEIVRASKIVLSSDSVMCLGFAATQSEIAPQGLVRALQLVRVSQPDFHKRKGNLDNQSEPELRRQVVVFSAIENRIQHFEKYALDHK